MELILEHKYDDSCSGVKGKEARTIKNIFRKVIVDESRNAVLRVVLISELYTERENVLFVSHNNEKTTNDNISFMIKFCDK